MKLWQQGLILLGLPLLFQISFAAILIENLLKIESAAVRESAAKQILATCQELRVLVFQTVTLEAAGRYLSAGEGMSARSELSRLLPEKIALLKKATAGDRENSNVAAAYSDDLNQFLKVTSYAEVQLADSKFELTRFANEREYMEEILFALSKLVNDERKLQKSFGAAAREFNPESMRRRQQLVGIILVAVLINVSVAGVLAVLFGRKTLSRLQVLMNNIKLFTDRRTELEKLEGKDELAELDRSFREMAQARTRAEDVRNTLMEMVTHDLRSPLSSSSLTLSMLLQVIAPKLEVDEARKLRRVNSEMKRLVRLSDSFLAVEKMEAGQLVVEKKRVYLEDLVDAALDAVRGSAEAQGVKFDTDYDADIMLWCDRDRTIQILVNLLSNSVKFSPSGGTVKIRSRQTDAAARIEIIDEGPGIPPEQRLVLFTKYSQLDQPGEIKSLGTGLGLYISKLLMEAQRGRIGASSNTQSLANAERPDKVADLNVELEKEAVSDTRTDSGTCFWLEFMNDES